MTRTAAGGGSGTTALLVLIWVAWVVGGAVALRGCQEHSGGDTRCPGG